MSEAEEKQTKSIIGSKYQDRYKEKDWLGQFIDANVTEASTREKVTKTKDEDGNEVETVETVVLKKRTLNLDKLFELSKANHIDTTAMEEQRDRKNAPGRIRMTLGNSLRAAAKHRHGLFDLEGNWVEAPEEFVGDGVKTQNPDGSKIVVAKVEAAEATNEPEAATEAADD